MEIVEQMPSEKLSGFLDDRCARLLIKLANLIVLVCLVVLEVLRVIEKWLNMALLAAVYLLET